MMITITIYTFIILYIIGRGFYITRKPLCNVQKKESFKDSISLSAMPFYSNMGSINLFAFVINFLLLSFISLTLLPDLILNTIAFCQDSDSFEEEKFSSDSDSDNEKNIILYTDENYIYKINGNREESIYKEERNPYQVLSVPPSYYPDNYDNIYKNTIEKTYRISNYKFPYIHFLNSFSNFEENNPIKINNYLKVFQGFSKDIENLFEKQNKLLQKISSIKEHSFKTDQIRDMFYEISKRSIDTTVLISLAFDKLIYFYNNDNNCFSESKEHEFQKPLIYYLNESENSNEYKLFNKILDKKIKGNIEVNNSIKSFLGDHQVNNLNEKITKIFNSLEIIQKISEENYNNLNNDNILIIHDIDSMMLKENQIKTFEELSNYYKKFNKDYEIKKNYDENNKINWAKIENIRCNINDFYKSNIFTKNSYQKNGLLNKGFYFKNITQFEGKYINTYSDIYYLSYFSDDELSENENYDDDSSDDGSYDWRYIKDEG